MDIMICEDCGAIDGYYEKRQKPFYDTYIAKEILEETTGINLHGIPVSLQKIQFICTNCRKKNLVSIDSTRGNELYQLQPQSAKIKYENYGSNKTE